MNMPRKARIAAGGFVALGLLGAGWAWAHDEGSATAQTTEDARLEADYSLVAPKVPGTIAQVLVEDNQPVRKGQLLAVLDDRDLRVAVASAEAELAAAIADVDGIAAALRRQSSVIAQAAAAVDADRAAVALAQANARRYRDLASDGSASQQEQQETESRLEADRAALRRDMAGQGAARAQVPMLESDLANARAAVARARAELDAARLNLSYAQIRAPVGGIVGRRTARVGNFVQVGAPLLAVVPVQQAYVEARYRETQLKRIRPGQQATIRFDMVPGVTFRGRVESIAPATGVSFASIAPENATGNFTKITQRLAVKITLDPNQPEARRLRVGMSAIPTINTEA